MNTGNNKEKPRYAQTVEGGGLAQFTEIFDFVPSSYLFLRRDGAIHQINMAGAGLLGLERERVIGRQLRDFIVAESRPSFDAFLHEVFDGRVRAVYEAGLVAADGRKHFVHAEAMPDQSAQTCLMSMVDITQRMKVENALRESEELFRMITENVSDLIAVLDTNGRRIYNSPSYRKIFGRDDLEVGSSSFNEIHPEDRQRIKNIFLKTVETGIGERSEFRFLLKDGSIRYIESQGNVVHNPAHSISKVVVVSRDVTERKKIEEQLRHLSNHDVLTGLPNRTLFYDRLKQAIAAARRDRGRILVLMFLDLDGFKSVNDSRGHAAGDMLLKAVAARLQDCLRESDTAARMGGDEFVVLLPLIETPQDALLVAEKIRLAVCQPIDLAGQVQHISPSIGIAVYPEDGGDSEALLRNADAAMYQAKKNGRNTVSFFADIAGKKAD